MATHVMTISWLAAAAGVHVETVRYYQRRGLLPAASAPNGACAGTAPTKSAGFSSIC
ncbi:MerR family DNA-binding transcriptional regulator [Xanthomonas hawaiiensis]|uniref:MerR family DNA-binding transcriptional regulator n=1 Tax=Xanthomonas hawaiiensis TaxID=3003247 RepID=UPI003CCDB025